MQNDEISPRTPDQDQRTGGTPPFKKKPRAAESSPSEKQAAAPEKGVGRIWEGLIRMGLGETTLRAGTGLLSILLFLIVIAAMSQFYLKAQLSSTGQPKGGAGGALAAAPTVTAPAVSAALPVIAYQPKYNLSDGILRGPVLRTTLSERARKDIITYTVQEGDSVFAIAKKFDLKPETILWGNRETLGDDPHYIYPGVELNILPLDGVYHKWSAGEGLNGVAKFFGVTPEDIISWPGNHLDMANIGDLSNPNIEPGTMLMIPGGFAAFSDWKTPAIDRTNPAVAKSLGPGFCGEVYNGVTGTGSFMWPTTMRNLSGYDYSPATNHYGIDIDGKTGYPIYAADSGVVVFSGEHLNGYGMMVVIDHGGGWQSYYAHLSKIYVGCGANVFKGAIIGDMGSTGRSTGPHLHFELRSGTGARVNPWDFLQ